MAKCKSCKTNIPEGTEYCADCHDKVVAKANESYLDSLLSSVKIDTPMENIYKKKNDTNEDNYSPDNDINLINGNGLEQASEPRQNESSVHTLETDLDDLYEVDYRDIEDFNQFDLDEDLSEVDSDIMIDDEELFGESLTELLGQDNLNNEYDMQMEEIPSSEEKLLVEPNNDDIMANVAMMLDENPEASIPLNSDQPDEEASGLAEDLGIDLDLDELLGSLAQETEATEENSMANLDDDMFTTFESDDITELLSSSNSNDAEEEVFEQLEPDHDEILSLLSQVSDEDETAEDIRAISEMLSGNLSLARETNMPSDVGEVFSDALTAVSSLNDYDIEQDMLFGNNPDSEPKKGKKGKKEKVVKEKKVKEKKVKEKAAEDAPKQSLFQRLFGNVKDSKTAEQFEEEQKKLTEPKVEKKKKAKNKNNAAVSGDEEDATSKKKGGKAKASKKADKKDKIEKKKKTKEVIEVIDEIDEDPGRINRLGAAVVFFFFGILATILVLGTNILTYSLNIQHAANYFNHRKYNQAYNEVYGVDIKDEDIALYDKIQTVMFVNKQLNSYNNYYSIGQYPEALDSLLKGLSRYDKYIELATMLGIESDLVYVRSQILAELNNVFELTEKDAMKILSYNNKEDYSLAVYEVVLEKISN